MSLFIVAIIFYTLYSGRMNLNGLFVNYKHKHIPQTFHVKCLWCLAMCVSCCAISCLVHFVMVTLSWIMAAVSAPSLSFSFITSLICNNTDEFIFISDMRLEKRPRYKLSNTPRSWHTDGSNAVETRAK